MKKNLKRERVSDRMGGQGGNGGQGQVVVGKGGN